MLIPTRSVVYRTVAGVQLRADLYEGDRERQTGVLLWFHGGALILDGRQDVHPAILALAEREAIPLVSVDYRLAPQADIHDIVADAKAAFRWVQHHGGEHTGGDPAKVLVAGLSAGGYLALLMGAMDNGPNAVLSYYGYGTLDSPWYTTPSSEYRRAMPLIDETDAMRAVAGQVVTDGHSRPGAATFYHYCRQRGLWPTLAAGVPLPDGREVLRSYSPTYHVTDAYPPTLLVHGTDDRDVPHAESVAMAAMLQLHRVPHEFISLVDLDHGLDPGPDRARQRAVADAQARVDEFVIRRLCGSTEGGREQRGEL